MFKAIIQNYKNEGFLHHAYLILGGQETARAVVAQMLETIEPEVNVIS